MGIPRELGRSSFKQRPQPPIFCSDYESAEASAFKHGLHQSPKNYLETGLKDNLLPLETDVLGPLHESEMIKSCRFVISDR